ncbi:MAG: hypothetical protein GX209_00075 [Epulopiscium sp.]|nr:hypothetical protein [Candidatus Epulonipiscium sp.]
MDLILNKFVSIYSIWATILTIGIGMMSFFVDSRTLKNKENLKEAKWAKWIGLIYMIGGAALFIFIKLLS